MPLEIVGICFGGVHNVVSIKIELEVVVFDSSGYEDTPLFCWLLTQFLAARVR